jgi:uncharacterized UPF0160 family protein
MPTLLTHSGPFHADDVVAYLVLSGVLTDARLVRSRDPAALQTADVVFDVGGEYDPARHRYDHHQPGGAGRRDNGVPFAAAGLVWRHFGAEFCQSLAHRHAVAAEALAAAIDRAVIQGIDAVDTGAREGPEPAVRVPTLPTLVGACNPVSLLEGDDLPAFDRAFRAAASAVRPFFDRLVLAEVGRLRAAAVIAACDGGRPVLELEPFCPWLEIVSADLPHVRLVLFRNPEGAWVCHTVPAGPAAGAVRCPLPASWAALTDEALQQATGVADALFCHPNRFLCAAASRAGALRLADLALRAAR